jgi:hypothetical protein
VKAKAKKTPAPSNPPLSILLGPCPHGPHEAEMMLESSASALDFF